MRNTMLFIPFVLLLSACSLITEKSDNTLPSSSTSETVASKKKVILKRLHLRNKQGLPQIMRKSLL